MDDDIAAEPPRPAESPARPGAAGQCHATSSGDGGGLVLVPPSDVLAHGRGGLDQVLEVLQDVADACRRGAVTPAGEYREEVFEASGSQRICNF